MTVLFSDARILSFCTCAGQDASGREKHPKVFRALSSPQHIQAEAGYPGADGA